jgi:hypothetical protein
LVVPAGCFILFPMFPHRCNKVIHLVGATFSFLCWGCGFFHLLASSSCTR